MLGDYPRSAVLERRNMEILDGDRLFDRVGQPHLPALIARVWLTWALSELGNVADGFAAGEEGVALAGQVDNPFTQSAAHIGLGRLYVLTGDTARAIAALERGLAICQERDVVALVPIVLAHLGYAYFLAGRHDEGRGRMEQALDRSSVMGAGYVRGRLLCWLGEAYLAAGDEARAHDAAEQALAHARAHDERGHEAYALHFVGQVASQTSPTDVDTAETHYRQAIALAEELGMRPLAAHCHLGLGTLYQRVDRPTEAQQELANASDMYRAMQMTFWLEQAEAARAAAMEPRR